MLQSFNFAALGLDLPHRLFRLLCLLRRLALLLLAATALPALAQAPAAAETPLKEIAVAASAFVRGAPLPAWADVLPLPPPPATRRALAVRLDDTHLRVADTPVQLFNQAQQVNDPGALGQIGQVSMFFNPAYQKLVLHKALILRGTETIDHTMSAQVRFLQREAGLEQGIYSGVITATMLLPDVRVGDTLHMQYAIEGANPIFGRRYAQAVSWERPAPVQWRRVTLSFPEARSVQWQWNGDGTPSSLTPEVSTSGGMKRLRFEERDVPGVELEPMLPRSFTPLRWLQFSEYADWGEVSRWADGLFPPDEPLPNELVPVIQRLLRLPTRNEQVSAALQWVQAEVRYYSVSLGESSHRPHPPAEVLRNRYGDCKDKSFLLMRMLQSLGIPARAVLASLGAPQRPARLLPSPLAFDHAVVQVRLDGRDFYLDPTRLGQRGPLERMGQGLEDASVLVVDARDVIGLSTVRSPNRHELFRSELSETFRLPAFTDDAELDLQQRWVGLQAEQVRLTLARFDPERLKRVLLTGPDRRYPGISLVGSPELVDEVDQNRITVRAKFKVPKLAVADAAGNWLMRFTPSNLQGSVAVPPAVARSWPLALPSFPTTLVYNAEMQWPDSVSGVSDAPAQRVSNAQFSAEVSRSFRGNVSRVAVQFEPLASGVPAKDVPKMLDDVKTMERMIGGTMTVARSQVKDGGFLGMGRKTLQDTLAARAQAVVERTGKALAGSQLSGDDLAATLCARAEGLANLGMAADGLKDADAAVKQAPTLAGAWQCHGNLAWATGQFAQASSDFGKALSLGQPPFEAYYRRGHARYFEGKLEQAAEDFAKAVADRKEPTEKLYAALWQAWTLQRLGRPLPADLLALATQEPVGAWPRPALAMLAGLMTPEQVIAQIERKQGDDRELALAEGWFYIGEHHLTRQQPERARDAFEKARAKGITMYVEHVAAGFELARLGAKP